MMRFLSRSHKRVDLPSVEWRDSSAIAGVQFAIRRISLAERLKLIARVQELYQHHEFLKAGDMLDQLEAAKADLLVKQLYLEWGLIGIQGLDIDGHAATTAVLIKSGPESLSDEIVEAIKANLGLTEEERKNY